MSKIDYKLIALDLDGTLLRNDYTISKRTIDCLFHCYEIGLKIIFCTGRRWHKVSPILKEIPFPVYCALNNGVILRWSEQESP
ncbi:HAD hydrolase family protein, partial [bacterium]|nr:HAD hydrolase family protein [bacterium]